MCIRDSPNTGSNRSGRTDSNTNPNTGSKMCIRDSYLTDAQNEVTMPQGSTQEIAWTLWNMGQYKAGSTGEGYNLSLIHI